MLDTNRAHLAIKPLHTIGKDELVLRTNPKGRIELGACLGERRSDGMPMVVLREAFRICDLPHADWWHPDQEILSLGTDWCIEPLGVAEPALHPWQDGVLLNDAGAWKLRLWHGPDNLHPVGDYYDLSKRTVTMHYRDTAACHKGWRLWQTEADRANPVRQPLFTYPASSLRIKQVA